MNCETEKRVVILGLGNLLLSDEGVGVHVVQVLLRMRLPSYIEVVDGGTGGFELIEHVRGMSKVIIIDCFNTEAKPGSIIRLTLDELSLQQPLPFSAHEGGIRELLWQIHALAPVPEVVVFGVVPADTNQLGMRLSAVVESRLPRIVSAVVEEATTQYSEDVLSDETFDLGEGD
ncbi:MAG TPA: hydrogenase maturation protease [Bacteroidota bacterium]|nr:hydrogenase maturation protease [Bacteroidota bacterium]